jgi:hypothetical protein
MTQRRGVSLLMLRDYAAPGNWHPMNFSEMLLSKNAVSL